MATVYDLAPPGEQDNPAAHTPPLASQDMAEKLRANPTATVADLAPADTPPVTPPPILSTPWLNLTAGKVWDAFRHPAPAQPGQVPFGFGDRLFGPPSPENDVAFQAGGARGVRNVTDKIQMGAAMGDPGTEGGIVPPTLDRERAADDLRKRLAADRAATYARYGGNPSFHAGVAGGETTATLPLTVGATGLLGGLVRAAGAPAIADFITGSGGTATRGLPGMATRAASRAVVGGEQGAVQGTATADPSKPLWPQIEA